MVDGRKTRIEVYMNSYKKVELWYHRILDAQGYLADRMLQYKFMRKICHGGQGSILLCYHKNSSILHAVKVLPMAKVRLASSTSKHPYQEA